MHFLFVGAGLFALFIWVNPDATQSDRRLVISQGQINHLVQRFERVWMREPTDQELKRLIEDFAIEEIYYREALAMGIEQDDPVIRRRLRQKMEAYTDTLATTLAPTDELLTQYLHKHADKFKTDSRYSFAQVYLSTDRPKQELEQKITTIAAALQKGEIVTGDPSLLVDFYDNTHAGTLERTFGRGFAAQLDSLVPGQWGEPIESGLGLHFIKLTDHQPGHLPQLNAVRASVEREWRFDQAQQIEKALREKMLAKYEIVVHGKKSL